MAAWGQTRAQRAQSMQMDGSQIGISAARLRLSHRAVPVGKVPSTGMALTGSRSPSPASIVAVTRRTKSGASAGTRGGRQRARLDGLRVPVAEPTGGHLEAGQGR